MLLLGHQLLGKEEMGVGDWVFGRVFGKCLGCERFF